MRIITEIKIIEDSEKDVPQEALDNHARKVYALMLYEVDESADVSVDVYKETEGE